MHLNYPENFAGRVNYAAAFMLSGRTETTRGFDNCFENNDGEVVIAALARRAAKNERLREGLYRFIVPASVDKFAEKYRGVRNLTEAARALRKKIRDAEHGEAEKGTPGPWVAEERTPSVWSVFQKGYIPHATVFPRSRDYANPPFEDDVTRAKANARLIAAAPDLLAAATAVIESDALIGNSVGAAEAFMALRKAIAKATGRD